MVRISLIISCFLIPYFAYAAVIDAKTPITPPQDFVSRLNLTTVKFGNQELREQMLRQQAYSGDATAQAKLGLSYSLGFVESIPANMPAAIEWFTRSAEQGNAVGQYLLGMSYLMTANTANETDSGVNWLRLAAEQGNADAQWQLSHLYRADGLLGDDSQQQRLWLQRAAAQQQPQALYELGRYYLDGRNGNIDNQQAFQYLSRAAIYNNDVNVPRIRYTSAMLLLADGFRTGLWGEIDKNKAHYWYKQVSNLHVDNIFADSLIFLKAAEMYANGWGERKYEDYAIEYYERAFDFPQAKLALTDLYAYETEGGRSPSVVKAFGTLYLAARQGDVSAQKRLGNSYLLNKQLLMAYYWLRQASHQADKDAKRIIQQHICGSATAPQASCKRWITQQAKQGVPAANFIECQRLALENVIGAYDYCLRAAEQHFELAEFALANWAIRDTHSPVQSLKEDDKARFQWLERAALDGNPQAQYELAGAYHYGIGVEVNLSRALAWYNISYHHGRGDALDLSKELSAIWYGNTPEHQQFGEYYSRLDDEVISPYAGFSLSPMNNTVEHDK